MISYNYTSHVCYIRFIIEGKNRIVLKYTDMIILITD